MLRLVPRVPAAAAAALIVVGIVLAGLGQGIAAMAVGGLGAVIAVSLAFYAVGRSEDLERGGRP